MPFDFRLNQEEQFLIQCCRRDPSLIPRLQALMAQIRGTEEPEPPEEKEDE